MRSRLLVPAALAAVLLLAAPATPATRRATCDRYEGDTIAKTSRARLFDALDDSGIRLYACLRPRGKRLRLSRKYDEGEGKIHRYNQEHLTGRYVGWVESLYVIDGSKVTQTDQVKITDLSKRRTRTEEGPAVADKSLAVASFGALGWAAPNASGGYQVFLSDEDGKQLLDEGSIDPASIRFKGDQLTWDKAGQTRSAKAR